MTARAELDVEHRINCRAHFARRMQQRAFPVTAAEIDRLEACIERMRPAFERDGRNRYRLTLIHRGHFLRVAYDTELQCLVTCLFITPFTARPRIYGESWQ